MTAISKAVKSGPQSGILSATFFARPIATPACVTIASLRRQYQKRHTDNQTRTVRHRDRQTCRRQIDNIGIDKDSQKSCQCRAYQRRLECSDGQPASLPPSLAPVAENAARTHATFLVRFPLTFLSRACLDERSFSRIAFYYKKVAQQTTGRLAAPMAIASSLSPANRQAVGAVVIKTLSLSVVPTSVKKTTQQLGSSASSVICSA